MEAGTLKEAALQHDFPDARLEAVVGSRAFVPEDGSGQLVRLIEAFLGDSAGGAGDGLQEGVYSRD